MVKNEKTWTLPVAVLHPRNKDAYAHVPTTFRQGRKSKQYMRKKNHLKNLVQVQVQVQVQAQSLTIQKRYSISIVFNCCRNVLNQMQAVLFVFMKLT